MSCAKGIILKGGGGTCSPDVVICGADGGLRFLCDEGRFLSLLDSAITFPCKFSMHWLARRW